MNFDLRGSLLGSLFSMPDAEAEVLPALDGLHHLRWARVSFFLEGKLKVTDGPFTEEPWVSWRPLALAVKKSLEVLWEIIRRVYIERSSDGMQTRLLVRF
jgi:hypothetical protein